MPKTTVYLAPPTAATSAATRINTASDTTDDAVTDSTSPAAITISAATAGATAPTETALTKITETLDALNADIHECYAHPDDCDIRHVLDTYFASDANTVKTMYFSRWQDLVEADEREVSAERIERTVVWVTADAEGVVGSSFHCEVDRSFDIPNDAPAGTQPAGKRPVGTQPVAPAGRTAEHLRFYYQWEQQPDGSWKIIGSELGISHSPSSIDPSDLPSLTPNEVRACA